MKKKALIIIGGLALAVTAVLLANPFKTKETGYTFDTVKVGKAGISNTVTATGTIEAITTVDVGTQVSGIIQHVYVDFNENVRQGQLLAKLDETSLKAQVEQSQSSVDQAQAQMNYEEANYERLKALYEKKLIARADFDQAVYNYENSKAALANAKSNLSRSNVNLDFATITSPIDGVVLNRAVEEGQTVAASFNTPTLFTIVNDLTQMEVQTSVDEADIGKVNQGQRVEFTVDAYSDMKFEGRVSQVRLQPVTTNNVVTYVVILSAPNPQKKLMPGMTASAIIYVEEKDSALILTAKALRFTPDDGYLKQMTPENQKTSASQDTNNTSVPTEAANNKELANSEAVQNVETPANNQSIWVKSAKGSIYPVQITTGIDNGSDVEILSGIKEGDEVVISMSGGTAATSKASQGDTPQGPFPF